MFGIDKHKIHAAFETWEASREKIDASSLDAQTELRLRVEALEKLIDGLRAAFE